MANNGNSNLYDSSKQKQDEFYTQLSLIESELKHYRKHFKDKTVFCNCDDPFESNFFKYFVLNFRKLGLKKLICTCYDGSPIAHKEISLFDSDNKPKTKPYKAIVTTVYDKTGDGGIDMEDIKELFKSGENKLTELEGNGDFASDECLALMDESDIVVTNPPFSLFRKYISLLVEHKKDFLIIGNQNNVTYSEVFPLIKNNKVWLGYNNGHFWFKVPDHYEEKKTDFKIDDDGQKWRRMGNICWFTNLDIKKRHEEMILIKRYTPEEYPRYDTYNAINVSRTCDIPSDFPGVIGVPITFMSKYCPEQFEIKGLDRYVDDNPNYGHRFTINGKETYARILIRNKHPEPPREV